MHAKILLVVLALGSLIAVLVMRSQEKQSYDSQQFVPLQSTSTKDHLQKRKKSQDMLLFPVHNITLPHQIITKKVWYNDLEAFLSVNTGHMVTLLSCSNIKYIPLLLNWLSAYRAATDSLLSEVLVMSTTPALHNTLIDKGFNSILVKNQNIFLPKFKPKYQKLSVWMKRITVARIINYLGHDVMIIDLDAIVLKDFATITNKYSTSDIVGSISKMPPALSNVWGFTMCMGAAFFRSTPGTEIFWNIVSNLSTEMQDDQVRINYGFKALDINWIQNQTCTAHHPKIECTAKGVTNVGFSVTLVPQGVVCRSQHCNSTSIDTYYIWHVRHGKEYKPSSGPMWFIKDNWKGAFDKHRKSRKFHQLVDEITAK